MSAPLPRRRFKLVATRTALLNQIAVMDRLRDPKRMTDQFPNDSDLGPHTVEDRSRKTPRVYRFGRRL